MPQTTPVHVRISAPIGAPVARTAVQAPQAAKRGWVLSLLPWIDQACLLARLGNESSFTEIAANPECRALLETRLELLVCPSDAGSVLNDSRIFRELVPGESVSLARANYVGSAGDQEGSGIFEVRSIRLTEIRDGLGTTIFIGERSTNKGRSAALWAGINAEQGNPLVGGSAVLGTTRYRLNDGADGRGSFSPTESFSSAHSGGAQFLFGDGSVKFISDSVPWTPDNQAAKGIFNRLGDRADGDPVPQI